MRFHRLDLNLLVVLDTLLSELNISRAGERLNLSQSATSGALARLRDYFGDELLVQIGRKMVPTPLGESLAKPVRDILIQVRTTVEARPVFAPGESQRRFTFMVSDYVATVFIPEVARRVHRVAPHITFEMRTLDDTAFDSLDRGLVDFLVLPVKWVADAHPSLALFQDSYVCVAWTGNDEVGGELSYDQYMELGHVIVRWGTSRLPTVDEWFLSRRGLERRVEVVANGFNGVPHFLVGTNRIATTHKRLADIWTKTMPLKVFPVPTDVPSITEALQWNKYQDLDPGGAWLRGMMKDVAADMQENP